MQCHLIPGFWLSFPKYIIFVIRVLCKQYKWILVIWSKNINLSKTHVVTYGTKERDEQPVFEKGKKQLCSWGLGIRKNWQVSSGLHCWMNLLPSFLILDPSGQDLNYQKRKNDWSAWMICLSLQWGLVWAPGWVVLPRLHTERSFHLQRNMEVQWHEEGARTLVCQIY